MMGILNKPGPRRCECCGASKTIRGNELTGRYCSPTCKDRALARPDSHGAFISGRGRDLREQEEREESYSMRDIYNPFKELFDGRD